MKPLFGDFVGEWHRWFAWKPVRTFDQRIVWLRFVWRRCVQKHLYLSGGSDFWWFYSLFRGDTLPAVEGPPEEIGTGLYRMADGEVVGGEPEDHTYF